MNELNISYITAKQYICLKQRKKFELENNIPYEKAFLQAYDDMNYNISML